MCVCVYARAGVYVCTYVNLTCRCVRLYDYVSRQVKYERPYVCRHMYVMHVCSTGVCVCGVCVCVCVCGVVCVYVCVCMCVCVCRVWCVCVVCVCVVCACGVCVCRVWCVVCGV